MQLLQVVLKEEVDPYLRVTGYFYNNTEKALKTFQQKYNLKIIGYLDDKTLEKINEVYITRLCPKPTKEFPDFLLFNISKNNRLPLDYIPSDLERLSNDVDSDGIVCLRKEAKEKLIEMLNDAKKEGLEIIVVSGFRRSEIQEFLYNTFFKKNNKKTFDIIALPGHSEHQLGTVVDLDSKRNRTSLESHFDKTPEGKWLIENAWKYGFVLSYPKGKGQITGYEYEPWHYRYVDQEVASIVKNKNITLIEYLNNLYISRSF